MNDFFNQEIFQKAGQSGLEFMRTRRHYWPKIQEALNINHNNLSNKERFQYYVVLSWSSNNYSSYDNFINRCVHAIYYQLMLHLYSQLTKYNAKSIKILKQTEVAIIPSSGFSIEAEFCPEDMPIRFRYLKNFISYNDTAYERKEIIHLESGLILDYQAEISK